jgi:NADH:ubiquinone oxidoreductase subunit E
MERRETETLAKKEIDTGTISRQIQKVIDDTRGKSGALIRVLQQTQGFVGYLPPPVLEIISRYLKVPLSEVYGIVSFYHFFTMVPKGRHVIQVCLGTSCYVKGGQKVLDTLKKEYNLEPEGITPDGKFSLETVRCLGACALSPVITVGTDIHKKVKPTQLKELLGQYK